MSLPDHIIRPAEPGDRGYIIDTWLQTYRPSPFARKLPDWAYWSRFGHVGLVEHLVDSPDTRIAVACLPEGGAWQYGWVAYTFVPGLIVHYLFVRQEFREQGLGRVLLDQVYGGQSSAYPSLAVTHLTPGFSRRLGQRRQIVFRNPYKKPNDTVTPAAEALRTLTVVPAKGPP